MKRISTVFVLATALLAGGCAYYKIQPIPAASFKDWGQAGGSQSGYIFYQPELYFSATISPGSAGADGAAAQSKPAVTVTPVYLPNYQKPYRLTTHNFLAKADFNFSFENGWKLTQISDKADNSTVANTLAGQLQTILSAAGAGVRLSPTNASQLRVILYRPVYDRNGYVESFAEVGATETK